MGLTATERLRLAGCQSQLVDLCNQLENQATTQLGFVLAVAQDGGLRSTALQTALYNDSLAQGGGSLAYPVATPGRSYHEYGAAFDVHIIRGGSNADGTGSDDDYRQLADLGQSIGLRAGYYFSNSDPYHFELNEPLQTAIDQWNALVKSRTITGMATGAALLLAVLLFRH